MKSLSTLIASAAAVFALTAVSSDAEANIILSQRGCQSYASWSGNIVWARDLGADKDKTKAELVQLDQKTPASIYALMPENPTRFPVGAIPYSAFVCVPSKLQRAQTSSPSAISTSTRVFRSEIAERNA